MTLSPEWMMLARTALAFLFVVGLIFLSAAIAKKAGLDKRLTGNKGAPSLSVVETLYLDPKHRLVKVRSGDREHLLVIGAAGDLLIDSRDMRLAGETRKENP